MSIDTRTLPGNGEADSFKQASAYAELHESSTEPAISIEERAGNDPRIIENGQRIKELRDTGRVAEAEALVTENKALFAQIVDELNKASGRPTTNEREAQAEVERQTALAQIDKTVLAEMEDAEQLRRLGLLDSEGKVTLDSPLIDGRTKRALHRYFELVRQTEAMSKVANQYGQRVRGFVEADRERTKIHDEVAKYLADDLGLEFAVARKLVVKARDEKMPGASESALYASAARATLKRLDDYGNDLGMYMREGHQRIEKILAEEPANQPAPLASETGAVGLAEPIKLTNPVDVILEGLRAAGRNDYQQRAEELLEGIRHGISSNSVSEAIDYLRDEYLDRPQDDVELQRLTQLILRARQQALLQDRLNRDRESLHNDPLTHEEYVSVGGHYEMLRREACEFNHSLRLLMENNGHHFTRDQLTEWIGQASQGRYRWAEGEVTGAASELAVHAALQGMPELKEVRYGSVDEDLAGYDFVCKWQGKLLSIDAKTGHYPPVEERKHGHKHIEVSVPREVIKNFTVSRRGLERIRHDVRNALDESLGNVHHVNHRYYQKG